MATSKSTALKLNYQVLDKYEAFFTGGKVQVSADGGKLFCCCENQVKVVDVETGKAECEIGEEDDPEIHSFVLSPDDKYLVVADQNMVLKMWDWRKRTIERTWKSTHTAHILHMAFDPSSTLVATGRGDSSIKVCDILKQYWTHNFKGHTGRISALEFQPEPADALRLASGGDDSKIRMWDLNTKECLAVLEGHFSTITALQFAARGTKLLSGSRDKLVILWDIEHFKKLRTIPVYEALEGLVCLETKNESLNVTTNSLHFITAGQKGVLRVWDAETSICKFTSSTLKAGGDDSNIAKGDKSSGKDEEQTGQSLQQLVTVPSTGQYMAVTREHHFLYFDESDLTLKKQLIGHQDEILSTVFLGSQGQYAAVASNSPQVKVFDLSTWSCTVLEGHTDTVVGLAAHRSGSFLLSCAKDDSIRLWKLSSPDSIQSITCVFVGTGHAMTVNSVCMPRLKLNFLVSVSQDTTVKLWELPSDLAVDISGADVKHQKVEGRPTPMVTVKGVSTEKAHDKDITSVDISPNDQLIATGSSDKTAKIWSRDGLELRGILRGHSKGIWCVKFSPVDQVVATGSGDGQIRMWSLSNYATLKTFEGHGSSVLQVNFLSRGMQLISSGSDGQLMMWNIKNIECIMTEEAHDDKIWALAVGCEEERLITGGGGSSLILWKNVTEANLEEAHQKASELILKEQTLSNLVKQKKYAKAFSLALELERPLRLLKIIRDLVEQDGGENRLETIVDRLDTEQLDGLLRYVVEWNTNRLISREAQLLLGVILRSRDADFLIDLPSAAYIVEGLMPYGDRHWHRYSTFHQKSLFMRYTWHCVKPLDSDIFLNAESSANTNVAGEALLSSSSNTTEVSGATAESNKMEVDDDDDEDSDTDSEEEEMEDEGIEDLKVISNKTSLRVPSGSQGESEQEDSDEETDEGDKAASHDSSRISNVSRETSSAMKGGRAARKRKRSKGKPAASGEKVGEKEEGVKLISTPGSSARLKVVREKKDSTKRKNRSLSKPASEADKSLSLSQKKTKRKSQRGVKS